MVYKIWYVYVAGSMIGDLYRNGREFCEKRNYQCEPMESQNCFTFDSTLDKVSAAKKTFYVNVETSFLYFALLILHIFVEVGSSIGWKPKKSQVGLVFVEIYFMYVGNESYAVNKSLTRSNSLERVVKTAEKTTNLCEWRERMVWRHQQYVLYFKMSQVMCQPR